MQSFNRLLRHLYDPEPLNDSKEDIHCLAQIYRGSATDGPREQQWPVEFVDDVRARFWFTYRTGFSPIPRKAKHSGANSVSVSISDCTADTGFGCMIRAAQTLLANAIARIKLGRQWRCGQFRHTEAQILRMFADSPIAPFSIHKFIDHGASKCHIPVGDWFGPSAASQSICALVQECYDVDLYVYVTSDQGGVIYEETIMQQALLQDISRPVLILIPQRLGLQTINPKYHENLLTLFSNPSFVGIAGGRPSSAHFFFARQANFLFFLDPHFPQEMLPYHSNLTDYTDQNFASVHTKRLRRMKIADLDPSMLIAFLIEDVNEWIDFKASLAKRPHELQLAVVAEKDSKPASFRDEDFDNEMMSDEEGLQ